MSTENQVACASCGNAFFGALEFCPVCLFQQGLTRGSALGKSSSGVDTMQYDTLRFGHYELLEDELGKPVELGRGAMGVTYKAIDVDLQCPVTLKGERLAKLVSHRRTLLVLDGLEPLQNQPGPQEGRLREPSLQALLRELAAFNAGLCLITSRTPVADIADHEHTSALRRNLDHLSSDAGAKLLRALGVKGDETELRSASDEFSGHCLALTLLGGYLTDSYNGEIRCRKEVSTRLAHDVRQGVHARKVMESYQSWLGEGPELSVLRLLGLFDRPADEKALGGLLKPPAIHGLTESLTNLSPTEWRIVLAKLRRARLLAGEDPQNPGYLDTHPLVREYFGEQLRSRRTEAWKESNKRLYHYYRELAPGLPESFRDMEPLFRAVICGCNAGLYREALHEVYIPRIQRGNASFAAKGAIIAPAGPLVHWSAQIDCPGLRRSVGTLVRPPGAPIRGPCH